MKNSMILGILLVSLTLASCVQTTPPTQKDVGSKSSLGEIAPNSQTLAKEAWEVKWDSLVANAKKEGRVSLYITPSVKGMMDRLSRVFYDKYKITLEYISISGGEGAAKILAERAAGLYLLDVYLGGGDTMSSTLKPAGIFDPLEPVLILPEVVNPALWYDWKREGGLPWLDPKDRKMFGYAAYVETGVGINTKMVKPDEIKSFKDLNNSKWYQKIIINDPTVAGAGLGLFVSLSRIYGMDYWKSIVKLEPVLTRNERLQVEWLSQGKYPVAIAPNTGIMTQFIDTGADVTFLSPQEGILQSGGGCLALVNRAPHPNAAKVFINWFLTKDAQTIYVEENKNQSAREDVPTSGVFPAKIRKAGVEYFFTSSEDFNIKKMESRTIAADVFKDLLPR